METGPGLMYKTEGGTEGLSSSQNTQGNASYKTFVSVLHVDMKTLSSMKAKDAPDDNVSVTPVSDSGLGHSDGGDGEFKSPLLESPDAKNNNSSVLVKPTHLDLDMQEKNVSPDFCPSLERRSMTQIFGARKSKPPLPTPQRKTKKEHVNVSDSKKPLQWLDIHSDKKSKVSKTDSTMTSRTGSKLSLQSKDEWMLIEKELRKYEASGVDPHRALYSMISHNMTPSSSRVNTSRLDWQAIARSIGDESMLSGNDYFSIYPWSMKKKNGSNPLIEYIQHSNLNDGSNTETRETDSSRSRPPKSKRNSGPSGITYIQNARGFAKKGKSKTPGEMAIEEARAHNSKKSKIEAIQVEVSVHRSKTGVSIPTLSKSSSVESLPYVDQHIRLPELPNHRVSNGKIYSGIYRLATPPTARMGEMRTAASVPSLQAEMNKSSFPLQVKNCGVPSNDIHLFTHALKSYRSSTDLSKDKTYNLPMIYTNRTNTSCSKESLSETFHVHPLSQQHKARQKIILQTVYGRESTEPPRPPPVTPNVKQGRAVMSAGEMASLLHRHNRPYQKTNQTGSHNPLDIQGSSTSLFSQRPLEPNMSQSNFQHFYSESESGSEDDEDEISDEKSSIHSVSSIDCTDGHQFLTASTTHLKHN